MKTQILSLQNPIHMMRISFMATILALLSMAAFAQSTVVDIVVNSSDHNTLEAAVIAAELADDLSEEGPFTLFAPTDAAFGALPEGTVASLLEDPTGDLAKILLYHVVAGKALSTDLSNDQMIATLNGEKISVKFTDGKAYIDNAMVTVADIKADNGVVHVINAVITPSSKMADAGKTSRSSSSQGCDN
ncbi:MAG: fasciclin domain-containing protein [Bacteroidales bacterium]|nr:fasciclin domain-containing protein [Bacteroidales bacterium]